MSLVERFRQELEEHRHPRTYSWVNKLLAQLDEDAELVQEAVHNGAMAELIALSKLMEDVLMTDVVVKQEDLDALGDKLEGVATVLAKEINDLLATAAAAGVTPAPGSLEKINTALTDLSALETPQPVPTPPVPTPTPANPPTPDPTPTPTPDPVPVPDPTPAPTPVDPGTTGTVDAGGSGTVGSAPGNLPADGTTPPADTPPAAPTA